MAQLAIKGHATRGSEVIELLEMLGAKNTCRWDGCSINRFYYINNNIIEMLGFHDNPNTSTTFGLDEFLEKFPYKIGDRVVASEMPRVPYTILAMHWLDEVNEVLYELDCNGDFSYYAKSLKSYNEKEETMEDDNELKPVIDLTGHCKDEYLVELGDYEIQVRDGKTYFVKKQPQYPKTLEECCKVLLLNPEKSIYGLSGLEYKRHVIVELQRLLICRDAYWKAGDWKPGRTIMEQKYYIHSIPLYLKNLLPFPTEEMRDAFYKKLQGVNRAMQGTFIRRTEYGRFG